MPDNNKKTVVFYHAPCLDGSAAAWMAYKKYGDEATYVGINHDGPDAIKKQILDRIDENTDVVFVDYSPYALIMDDLLDHARSITTYDHHAMAIKKMTEYLSTNGIEMPDGPLVTELRGKPVTMVFDRSRSGAAIIHDSFFPDEDLPLLLALVQRIDFEQYAVGSAKARRNFFSKAAFLDSAALGAGKDIKAIVATFECAAALSENELIARGAEDHQRNAVATEKAVQKMLWAKIPIPGKEGFAPKEMYVPVLAANLQQCGREFIARLRDLAEEKSPGRVALSWFIDDKNIYRVSVRSNGFPSASEVAAYLGDRASGRGLGGGGTPTSAAAQFTMEQFGHMFNFVTEAKMMAELKHSGTHAARSQGGGGSQHTLHM